MTCSSHDAASPFGSVASTTLLRADIRFSPICLLVAQSRHRDRAEECLLSGVRRTYIDITGVFSFAARLPPHLPPPDEIVALAAQPDQRNTLTRRSMQSPMNARHQRSDHVWTEHMAAPRPIPGPAARRWASMSRCGWCCRWRASSAAQNDARGASRRGPHNASCFLVTKSAVSIPISSQ